MLRRSRRRSRRLAAAIADTHAGHVLGLLNPDTVLVRQLDEHGEFEEWCPEPTATQRLLWPFYQEDIGQLANLADGDPIVLLHVGDPVHGTKYQQGLIADVSRADQRRIAVSNLTPSIALPNVIAVRLYTGTAAHVWPGYADARVAWALHQEFPRKDIQSVHHSRLMVGGEILDISHHGPHPGSRDWLRGNVARFYLRDRIYRDRRMGKEPARGYIRGHRHVWLKETMDDRWADTDGDRYLTVVPAYSGFTGFARQITQSEPELQCGMVVYEMEGGRLTEIHPFVHYEDLRLEETL